MSRLTLPQVVKTWLTRSAHDFSLATLLMLESGTSLWIVCGVLRDAPAIWLGNGVTFVLAGFILAVKVGFTRARVSNRQGRSTPARPDL